MPEILKISLKYVKINVGLEKVAVVETDFSNIKITGQNDIAIAEAILKSRPKPRPKGPVGPYADAQW